MSLDNKHRPIVLIILDGWGYRTETEHNPTQSVATPTVDALYKNTPHTLLEASGTAVGLPEGQMGNSEVGHLHLGAGRKVPQNLARISSAIHNQEFFANPALKEAIATAKQTNRAVHILGLLSPGGVHSAQTHMSAMIKMVHENGVQKKLSPRHS